MEAREARAAANKVNMNMGPGPTASKQDQELFRARTKIMGSHLYVFVTRIFFFCGSRINFFTHFSDCLHLTHHFFHSFSYSPSLSLSLSLFLSPSIFLSLSLSLPLSFFLTNSPPLSLPQLIQYVLHSFLHLDLNQSCTCMASH